MIKKDSNYVYVHLWLRNNYGLSYKCESVNCLGKSRTYNWSKIKEKSYERKRENFWMLCRSCHAKYDLTEEGRKKLSLSTSINRMGAKHSKKSKKMIGIGVKKAIQKRIKKLGYFPVNFNLKEYNEKRKLNSIMGIRNVWH